MPPTWAAARRPGSSTASCSTVAGTPSTPEVRPRGSSRSWASPTVTASRKTPSCCRGGKLSSFPADLLGLLRTDVLDAGDKLALVRLFVALGAAKPHALAKTSIQELFDLKIRRPQLRRLMMALARTFVYSTALDLVSAEVFVEKFQRSLRYPVHYVDGGWRTLVDELRAAAERAGARIVSDAHVEGVELGDGRARGVRLRDGRLVQASAVVVATGAWDAAKLVDGGEHPAMRRIVEGLTPARIACLDVALERLPIPDRPVVQDLD